MYCGRPECKGRNFKATMTKQDRSRRVPEDQSQCEKIELGLKMQTNVDAKGVVSLIQSISNSNFLPLTSSTNFIPPG